MRNEDLGAGGVTPFARADAECLIENFAFASSQVLPVLRLCYSTLGTPQYNDGQVCNAVLLLHSSTGNRLHWLSSPVACELFGPGQPLDAQRYFIIIPDLPGHGQSSKPSDGLQSDFPAYRCSDMAHALHLLVTRGLHIEQLCLLMGTSLGAMVAWEWAHRYPDAAQRIVPIGAWPVPLSGRNWIGQRMIIESIRNDPGWAGGRYTTPPHMYRYTAPLMLLMGHGVRQLHDLAPNQAAADAYYQQVMQVVAQHDPNDFLYAVESTLGYDPSARFSAMSSPILAINFEDDEIYRSDLGVLDAAIASMPNARSILIQATTHTRGHLTYYQVDTWKHHLMTFLETGNSHGN